MSFVISTVTVASAVSNGGTLTFGYPSIPASRTATYPYPFDANHGATDLAASGAVGAYQTQPGDFYNSNGHKAYSSGNQAALVFGLDFTLTFNALASGITFTYQGASVLPVGSVVTLQLEFPGQDNGAVFKDDSRVAHGALAPVAVVRFGSPAAGSATAVLNAVADAGTALVALATPYVTDYPRALSIKSSTTDTTQTITIRGFDEYGQAMTETLSLNGTTAVNGKKAWKTVVSYQASAALAGNLSIGTINVFGFPFVVEAAGYVIQDLTDGAKSGTAGTFVAGVAGTVPTATTGDVRGTYAPNTTPNAAHAYEVMVACPDPNQLGLTQFAG